eukprot:CAMPEP_0178395964 /NCGR_PEP_ID=MMETSP0689_2-20121128/13489_1 /TAXON_ID=160604 /ORGANISM="Amphidinium massartii, Strain CS-259" /LENGTH=363 /DNA_ID=CAMNT_0020016633 /DNA_START=20 /DNA_END=1108 /DNA_ORIENTATION=-
MDHESEAIPVPGGHHSTVTTEDASGPILWYGIELNRVCGLEPGSWVRFGRGESDDMMLKGAGFEKRHCQIRWSEREKAIELRNKGRGTYVNEDELQAESRNLHHGDRITIVGKDIKYEFVLDTRALGVVDPDDDPRARPARTLVKPENADRKRQKLAKEYLALKRDLHQLDALMEEIDSRTELRRKSVEQLERKLQKDREADQAMHDETLDAMKKTVQLSSDLMDKRQSWEDQLYQLQQENEAAVEPYTKEVALVQDKVEKLKKKRLELLQIAHPERVALEYTGKAMLEAGEKDSVSEQESQRSVPSSPAPESGAGELADRPTSEKGDNATAAADAEGSPAEADVLAEAKAAAATLAPPTPPA